MWRKVICGTAIIISLAFILDRIFPLPLDKTKDLSFLVLDSQGDLLAIHRSQDDKWRLPLSLTNLNPFFKECLIVYEDKRFYSHFGVDPLALCRAIFQSIYHGHIVSGGSTITMQTVKLLSPSPRTWFHKLKEIARALQLEWHFSKDEILTFYLTLTPYGKNLEGIRAASLAYYGKEPFHLSPDQAALLVALPQNPNRYRPDLFPLQARYQRNKVLDIYQNKTRKLSQKTLKEALEEPIPISFHPFPHHAYHLSHNLQLSNIASPVQTTLRASLQKGLETLLNTTTKEFSREQTAAALIVDNHTHEIIAYVGSAVPLDVNRLGYIDMVLAVRSPGSTLKTLIYALAFHEGWLKPTSILHDRPRQFGTYTPTNFADSFHGDVTISEALQRSLNIPAVTILDRLGAEKFLQWLHEAGTRLRLPHHHQRASLAIALGGVGIRLYDLVTLYSAIANGGLIYPLKNTCQSEDSSPQRLFSEEVSQQITQILRTVPPPPGIAPKGELSPIAFKTGTSYGHRDAWSIGYTHHYTVGVWVGRADGTPVPNQMGRDTAAPLLFRIFSLLEPNPVWGDPISVLTPFTPTKSLEKETLTITYPFHKSTLLAKKSYIDLTAQGGTPPYTWIINGIPVAIAQVTSKVPWTIPSHGFYEIVVVDNNGQWAQTQVKAIALEP